MTEPMRERARAEAHRLKGGRFTLDRSLTLALLRSANGCLKSTARAKLMLDAQERAGSGAGSSGGVRGTRASCARRY